MLLRNWNSPLSLLTRTAAPCLRQSPRFAASPASFESRRFYRKGGTDLLFGDFAAFPNVDIGPGCTHKPPSLAYFTGNSRYWDLKQTVDDYVEASKRLLTVPGITRGKTPSVTWLKRESIQKNWNVVMSSKEYRRIMDHVRALSRFNPLPYKFQTFVDKFVDHDRMKTVVVDNRPLLDMNGFAETVGRRKNCKVKCKLVEGEGEIIINGKPLFEFFKDTPFFRETVLQPFIATETLGKYNTWIEVEKGGPSGQSEAIAVAISRGICLHRPELVPVFNKLKLLQIDPRRVESKKPGQPKARKKNAWVKR